MFMNEYDIERCVEVLSTRAPGIAPYARYLADWRDVVNANSDGWPYWRAGTRCADRLMGHLQSAMDTIREGRADDLPNISDLDKSLRPIKAMATRHNLTAPVLNPASGSPAP